VAAYIIADVTVTDPATMEEYRKHVPATLTAFGGRFIVRGGAHQTLEGDWKPNRLVILEFPTLEQARRWYDSEQYREPKAMRLRASRTNLVMVDGISSPKRRANLRSSAGTARPGTGEVRRPSGLDVSLRRAK
jgi:uncharacterized protein (DUF1330 family)